MIVKGNPKRLMIGLWVLAALLLLWYNAAAIMSLLDKPLPGLSPDARATIAKWQRLENHMAMRLKQAVNLQEIENILAKMDVKKIKAILPVKKSATRPGAVKKPQRAQKKDVKLPALNGIMAVYGADGKVVYLAVVDGKTREENSNIGKFILEKIDTKGILLTQDKENWFVPAPTVEYSMDKSMEE